MSLVRVIAKGEKVLADKEYDGELTTATIRKICNEYKDAIGAFYFTNKDLEIGYRHPLFVPTDAYQKYLMDNNLW